MPPLESYTKEELVQLAKQQWYELEKLKKLIYGAKSERFVPELGSDAQQLRLRFGEDAEAEVAPEAVKEQITYERTKPEKKSTPHGRGLLPEHLERKIVSLKLDLKGTVRLTCPEPSVPRIAASGLLDRFHACYPGLTVEFVTSDRYLDLAKGEADVAFRSG